MPCKIQGVSTEWKRLMLFVITWGLELQKVNAEEFFVSHHLNFILYMLSYREIVLQTL